MKRLPDPITDANLLRRPSVRLFVGIWPWLWRVIGTSDNRIPEVGRVREVFRARLCDERSGRGDGTVATRLTGGTPPCSEPQAPLGFNGVRQKIRKMFKK